jgi:hypothetical protein
LAMSRMGRHDWVENHDSVESSVESSVYVGSRTHWSDWWVLP